MAPTPGVTIEEYEPSKEAVQAGSAPPTGASAAASKWPGEQVDRDTFPVDLTDAALKMVRAALADSDEEDGEILRVGVRGGGCSGFSYCLNFVDDTDEDDTLIQIDGVVVAIDPFSAGYLKGTVVDYVETVQGAGFKFENPQAKKTCGCGSSFTA
jgi:iron-sulfur cluster assembly accessory protein